MQDFGYKTIFEIRMIKNRIVVVHRTVHIDE